MTISIRLDEGLEKQLTQAARLEGVSKSDLVRRCLQKYLDSRKEGHLPWELGKHLFGCVGSGRSDLSKAGRGLVKEKIHAKKGRV